MLSLAHAKRGGQNAVEYAAGISRSLAETLTAGRQRRDRTHPPPFRARDVLLLNEPEKLRTFPIRSWIKISILVLLFRVGAAVLIIAAHHMSVHHAMPPFAPHFEMAMMLKGMKNGVR